MNTSKNFNQQRGNVLFLVLIAVALFAALSYAVTQSSRSGGGASNETAALAASQITQYLNGVRTAVTRMVLNGVDPRELQFNRPSQFSGSAFTATKNVFNVNGGGAVYQQIPGKFSSAGSDLDALYGNNNLIDQVGSSPANTTTDDSGNDIIGYVSGLTQAVCIAINKALFNDGTIPVITTAVTLPTATAMEVTSTAYTFPNTPATALRFAATGSTPTATPVSTTADVGSGSGTITAGWMAGKAAGCIRNGTSGSYVYFHVLYER